MRCWVLVLAAACGRIGFDPTSDGAPSGDGELPALVCNRTTIPVSPITASDVLTISPTQSGFAVAWGGGAIQPIWGMLVDAQLAVTVSPQKIISAFSDELVGFEDTG